jgi:tetratricopeptide (TPR) repeat protein
LLALTLVASLLAGFSRTAISAGNIDRAAAIGSDAAGRLLADVADQVLDEFSLGEAALIAGGVTDERHLAAFKDQLRELHQAAARETADQLLPHDRGHAALDWLHEHVLTGSYQASCTDLRRTLTEGHFNCVTATVLYRDLAAGLGLPVTVVAEPDHVYCRLKTTPPVEIQTTSRQGFGTQVPSHQDDLANHPPEMRTIPCHARRELSDVELLARIYFNRGVAALEQARFAAAFELLQTSCRLDPQDTLARQNRLACLNNWALAESDAGRFAQAVQLLAQGARLAPRDSALRDNDLHVHHRWVTQLCQRGDFARALAVLEAGHQRRPDAPLFDAGRLAVCQIWRQALVASGQTEALTSVEQQIGMLNRDPPQHAAN